MAHLPLHVVGQHAKQDVNADAIWRAVVDGPHVQIDGLQTVKGSLSKITIVHTSCIAPLETAGRFLLSGSVQMRRAPGGVQSRGATLFRTGILPEDHLLQ